MRCCGSRESRASPPSQPLRAPRGWGRVIGMPTLDSLNTRVVATVRSLRGLALSLRCSRPPVEQSAGGLLRGDRT